MPTVEGERNEYDDIVEETRRQDHTDLRISMVGASRRNPDKHAEVLRLADRLGLDAGVVERNFDKVRQRGIVEQTDYDAILRDTPGLAEWMKDTNNASVAQDDFENLSLIEKQWWGIKHYGGVAAGKIIGFGGQLVSGTGEVLGVAERGITSVLRKVTPDAWEPTLYGPEGSKYAGQRALTWLGDKIKQGGAALEPQQQDFFTKAVGAVAQLIPQVATFMVNPAVGLSSLFAQGADIMAEKVEGDDSSQTSKDVAVVLGGAATAITERFSIGKILERIPPNVKNTIGRFFADLFVTAGVEAGQELTEAVAHDVARKVLTNPDAPMLEGITEEMALAGTAAGMFRAFILLASGAGRKTRNDGLSALTEASNLSKLRERSPDKFEEVIAAMTGNAEAYFDAKAIVTYLQSKAADVNGEAVKLGINPEALNQAVATETDVAVPMSKYMTYIVPSEHAQFFADEMRLSPNDVNAREEREHGEEVKKESEAKEPAVEPAEQTLRKQYRQEARTIGEGIKKQLQGTKFKREADAYAKLIESSLYSLAQREKLSPQEIFKRKPLTVKEGEGAVPEDALRQSKMLAPIFYSKLQRTLEEKMPNAATAQHVQGLIKDLKEEERKWSGIDEFLKGKEKVGKQELLDFLRANQLEVREVMKGDLDLAGQWEDTREGFRRKVGDQWVRIAVNQNGSATLISTTGFARMFSSVDEAKAHADSRGHLASGGQTKFQDYTLPGGENYRELLLTLPPAPLLTELPPDVKITRQDDLAPKGAKAWYIARQDGTGILYGQGATEDYARSDALLYANTKATESAQEFRTSHFDEPNVLAHVRFNERTDSEGKRVLFIEEIQSDWHQAGRKRGYAITELPENEYSIEKQVLGERGERWVVRPTDGGMPLVDAATKEEAQRRAVEFINKNGGAATLIPDAPFKKTWHEFALKRMIRYAAENGFDKIAWTTGEQQAERYDLSKHLDEIVATKTVSGFTTGYEYRITAFAKGSAETATPVIDETAVDESKVEELVGKDLAKKIGAQESGKDVIYSGLDLKVGGEGMRGFYDEIIPAFLNKFGKKYGAKVGETTVESRGTASLEMRRIVQDKRSGRYQVELSDGDLWGSFASEEEAHKNYEAEFQPEGLKVHALHVTQALKDAALKEGFSLFQPGEVDPRGFITIGNAKLDINLLKGADRSTFIHELGHFYLELVGDLALREGASAQTKADYETILKWLGVEKREQITREHHEKWAKGFEAYISEGKAPSAGLRAAFYRMARWLADVYRSIKDYFSGSELTPEVRGVMDRLLATDEEIAALQIEEHMDPLYKEARSVGMSDAAATAYMEAHEKFQQKAFEGRLYQVMEEIRREDSATWKEQRQTVRAEVEKEINAQPVWIALSNLMRGKLPDGSELPPGTIPLKLSKEGVDPVSVAALPKRIFAENGAPVDVAAEMFGFETGAAFVRTMVTAVNVDPEPASREAQIREQIRQLEAKREALEAMREPLAAEAQAATKEAKAGKEAIAKKLAETMRANLKAEVEDLEAILKGIKDRGGVRPVEKTELLPKALRAKKASEGVPSDELAQELADQGIISEADSDILYDWLTKAQAAVKAVKEKVKDVAKEARKLANERLAHTLTSLMENAVAQTDLRRELDKVTGEERDLERKVKRDPRVATIEKVTDQKMREQFGPRPTDEQIAERAAEAVHNEDAAKVMRMELEHMVSEDFATFKKLEKKITGTVPKDAVVKAQAQETIAEKLVGEINPKVYQATAARAGKAANDAFLKGDFQKAFDEKRRQRMNHYLFMEAAKAKREVQERIEKLSRADKSDEKLAKSRDVGIVNAARAILAAYGIGTSEGTAARYLDQMEKYDPEAYRTLRDKVEDATEGARDYREVPFRQFMEALDTVDALWDLSLRARQFVLDGKKVDIREVADKLSARMETLGHSDFSKRNPGFWDSIKRFGLTIKAALRRVEHWVDAMDGGDPNGIFRKAIWEPISNGANQYRDAKAKTAQKLLAIAQKINRKDFSKTIDAPEIGDTFKNKGELLAALLHTGNGPQLGSNKAKLLLGHKWAEVDDDGNVDTSRWDRFIKRMQDEGVLTKADYDFAQSVWDLFEELKPDAQKAHKDIYGYYFKEITADEIVTPWGTYRGGYVPAIVDSKLVPDAEIRKEREELEQGGNSFMFPSTGRGFTMTRVKGYNKPLALNLRMLTTQLDKVLRFTHIQPAVHDVGRLTLHPEFRAMLDSFDPELAGGMLSPWLQRAATQKVDIPSATGAGRMFDNFLRGLRKRTGQAIMTANVINSLQQATGISIAATKVKMKHLRNALWTYIKSPTAIAESIADKSVMMRNRTSTQMIEANNAMSEILLNANVYQTAKMFADRHAYFLQQAFQNQVDIVTWLGAYEQAVERGASEADAVREADSAVRETQGSFAPEDMANFEAMRPFYRLFTMFTSYFNMKLNLGMTEAGKILREHGIRKGHGKLLYLYAMGFAIPATVAGLIVKMMTGWFKDDDDDGYLDEATQFFFAEQAKEGASMVPFVGQPASRYFTSTGKGDDRLVFSPVLPALESGMRALEGEYSTGRKVKDLFTLLSLASGIPVAPAGKPVGYAMDVERGKVEPSGALDYVRGLVTGR